MGGARHRDRRGSGAEAAIRQIGGAQHGVVARSQLLEAGVAVHAIDHRLRTGALRRLHSGVYGVGPLPLPLELEMAAVLACGETAALSHATAAVRWALFPPPRFRAARHAVEVSVRRGHPRPGSVVRLHRVRGLRADEVTLRDGIPMTVPERTILDLAPRLGPAGLERVVARAEREGLADRAELERVLSRHPGRPGSRALRALVARPAGAALTRSKGESRLLGLLRRAKLPEPRVNAIVEGFEVDFAWHDPPVVVEVDGFAFHSSREAFEGDRRRDLALAAAGFRVVRVTWRQLEKEPEAVLARLAQALVPSR